MKVRIVISSLAFLMFACGKERDEKKQSDEPTAEMSPNEFGSLLPSGSDNPKAEDKKKTLAICVLSGEEEDSCLAYRIVEASLGEGVEPKDFAAKNYTLKCVTPEGADPRVCKDFRLEAKK